MLTEAVAPRGVGGLPSLEQVWLVESALLRCKLRNRWACACLLALQQQHHHCLGLPVCSLACLLVRCACLLSGISGQP